LQGLVNYPEFIITVAYLNKAKSDEYFVNGIEYFYLGSVSYPKKFLNFFKLLKKVKPVIVQSTVAQADIFAGLAKPAFSYKWILRETSDMSKRAQSAKLKVRYVIGKLADKIVCNSQAATNYWKNNKKATTVIRNGTELSKQQLSPTAYNGVINFLL
jgi:hypothetical protein